MNVRMAADISGLRDGQQWPKRGETIDLPNHEAVDLLNAGLAEAIELEPAEVSKPAPPRTATRK